MRRAPVRLRIESPKNTITHYRFATGAAHDEREDAMTITNLFRRLLLSISIAAVAVSACAATLTSEEQADLKALQTGGPMQRIVLDMSNATHERFYRKQIALAAVDAQAKARIDAAIARAKSGGPTQAAGLFTIADLSSSDYAQWTSDALGAAPGAMTMVLTLGVYANNQPIGQVTQSTVYNRPYTTVSSAGVLPAPHPGIPVTAVLTSFWQGSDGTPYFSTQSVTTTALPASMQATAPNAAAPPILVCRRPCDAPPPKCTYACATGMHCKKTPPRPDTIMFPVIGSATFHGAIDRASVTNATWLIAPANGAASSGDLKLTRIAGKTLSWNFDPARFRWADHESDAIYVFAAGVTINKLPVWTFINNLAAKSSTNTVVIPAMRIADGRC